MKPWPVALSAMLLCGASQVSISNTVQNYDIDAFESMAASALAGRAFLRSIIEGVVLLLVSKLLDSVGHGWGTVSVWHHSGSVDACSLVFFLVQGKNERALRC